MPNEISDSQLSLDTQITLAQAALDGGNYDLARSRAKALLATDPYLDRAWNILIQSNFSSNLEVETLQSTRAWVEALPDSSAANFFRTLYSLLLERQKNQSRALVSQFKAQFPDRIEEIKMLDCFYEIEFGNTREASKLVDELTATNPETSFALTMQAANLNNLNQFSKAREVARKAVEIDPGDVGALRWQSVMAYRTMRYREAYSAAKAGQSLDPSMRVFPVIRFLSVISYFPLIYIFQLNYYLFYGVAGASRLPSILQKAIIPAGTFAFVLFVLLPTTRYVGLSLEEAGFSHASGILLWASMASAVIPELMIISVDQAPIRKSNPIVLKDY